MKRFLLVCLCLATTAALTPAMAADTGSARAHLNAFASGLHSLSGHFKQTLNDSNGHEQETTHGEVALKEPRLFRWQTNKPYKQLIVADGNKVWMYEPDLDQVTVHKQSQAESHSPLTVLTDMSRLDSDFDSQELGERDGLDWLRLTPVDTDTENTSLQYTELGFDGDTLRAMVFKDQLGNTTHIRFSDWKRNDNPPAKRFQFTPPDDADVVGQKNAGPEIHPLGN